MMGAVELLHGFDDRKASLEKVIEVVARGLPVKVLDNLAQGYGLTQQGMADLVGIPPRTLQRRRAAGLFDRQESERLYRYFRLYRRAVEVFDDDAESARQFLAIAQPGLDGHVPREMARSEFGAEAVMDLLGRIEYGVYT